MSVRTCGRGGTLETRMRKGYGVLTGSEPARKGIRQSLWQPSHSRREEGCRRAPGRRYLSM